MNPITFHPDIVFVSIILAINLGIISFAIYCRIKHRTLNPNWIDVIKPLGQLALAIGIFIQVIGLFAAFGDLEQMKETLPFHVIIGGIKATMPSTIHGFEVYFVSIISYIILRLTEQRGLV